MTPITVIELFLSEITVEQSYQNWFYMQGRSLLTILLIVLILSALGGLLYVQHHHFQSELLDSEQIIESLNEDIDQFKKQLNVYNSNQVNEQLDTEQRLEQYAIQIESLSKKHSDLKKTHQQSDEKLKQCENNLSDLKQQLEAHKTRQHTEFTTPTPSTASQTDQISLSSPMQETAATVEEENNKTTEPTTDENTTSKSALFQCPSADIVNQHIGEGQWQASQLKWWVEFSFRPLRDDEVIKKPFQVLFDGTHVDCYYRIGPQGGDTEISNTWLVIKGSSIDKKIILNNSWESCEIDGCENKCEYQNGHDCGFDLE